MNIIAIIPARSGSVRLKNKNKKKIKGISLVERAIIFSKKVNFINDIVVSTDDKRIIKRIKKYNFIKIFRRPHYLSVNTTKMIDVVYQILKKYEKSFKKVDGVLLLQPTSPYRSLSQVKFAFQKFKKFKKKMSIMSVSKTNNPEKKNFCIKNNRLIEDENIKKKNYFQANGNFYIASKFFLKKNKSFYYKGLTLPVVLNSKKLSIDIDNLKDFKKAKNF